MTRRLASVRRLGRSLRWVRLSLGAGALATAAGCSTTSIVLSVAGGISRVNFSLLTDPPPMLPALPEMP